MKYLTFLLVLSFLYCNAFGSYIADLNPPEWRGLTGSTTQTWSFLTDNTTPVADSYTNPYGTPYVCEKIDGEWYFADYIPDSWLTGNIEFYIPIDESADETIYRIQTRWYDSASSPIELIVYIKDANGNIFQTSELDDYDVLGESLHYASFELTVPNTGDYSVLFFEIYDPLMNMTTWSIIDEFVIDTISVPEPTSMLLLGLGGVLIRNRR